MSPRFKDYYAILGVVRSASQTEIQKEYRKLARKYHPDVNKAPWAEEKFKEIQEAHEALSDPSKRARYDSLGPSWRSGQDFHPPPNWGHTAEYGDNMEFDFGAKKKAESKADHSDFFESLFGKGFKGFDDAFDDAWEKSRTADMPGDKKASPKDLQAEVEISLQETLTGCTRRLTIRPASSPSIRPRALEVKIPKGVRHGAKVRVPGQGVPGWKGSIPGDLLIMVKVKPHPYLIPDGNNLRLTMPLTPWEAILGGRYYLPGLEKRHSVTIPPGASKGGAFRLEGKGLLDRNGDRGDLVVEIEIHSPRELSDTERVILEKLRKSSRFNPRPWEDSPGD